jgi:cytochrome c oxidase subunit I
LACFSRKRIFGYDFVACRAIAIAVIGFLVWAHHMFVAGISVYAGAGVLAAELLVAIPSAVKVFNWTATLYKGSITFDADALRLRLHRAVHHRRMTGLFLARLGSTCTFTTPTSWSPTSTTSWWAAR